MFDVLFSLFHCACRNQTTGILPYMPKALHIKAWGQRRSRATLGNKFLKQHQNANGVPQILCTSDNNQRTNPVQAMQG